MSNDKKPMSKDEQITDLQAKLERAMKQVDFHKKETKKVSSQIREIVNKDVLRRTIEVRKDLYRKFFPVVELLNLTLGSINETSSPEDIKKGIEMVYKEMFILLSIFKIEKIETVGHEFDYNIHEAVMQDCESILPKNTVSKEFEAGFLLDGQLLKPAKVAVSMGHVNVVG